MFENVFNMFYLFIYYIVVSQYFLPQLLLKNKKNQNQNKQQQQNPPPKQWNYSSYYIEKEMGIRSVDSVSFWNLREWKDLKLLLKTANKEWLSIWSQIVCIVLKYIFYPDIIWSYLKIKNLLPTLVISFSLITNNECSSFFLCI